MSAGPVPDRRTQASITTAWLVAANKPFYPLYVWWLTGGGLLAASLTALSLPLFAGLALAGKRYTRLVRAGVPATGMADTVLATVLFGRASGTELFLVPCVLLIGVALTGREKYLVWALTAIAFAIATLAPRLYPAPLFAFSSESLNTLRGLNIYCVAALSAFVVYRFASTDQPQRDATK